MTQGEHMTRPAKTSKNRRMKEKAWHRVEERPGDHKVDEDAEGGLHYSDCDDYASKSMLETHSTSMAYFHSA